MILTHTLQLGSCWIGVAMMPSVVYLCIALFTELFNLASGDIAVLITVSTLVESQASADSTFPWSWIIKAHTFLFWLTHCTRVEFFKKLRAGLKARKQGYLHLSWVAVTTQTDFITQCHKALIHHWSAKNTSHLHTGKKYWLQLTVFKKVCDV